MILHIFNPEHDLALAADMPTFTSPHAARQLRYDIGHLPAIWAQPGDVVLVENTNRACREIAKLNASLKSLGTSISNDVMLVEPSQLYTLPIDAIEPWGWNSALTYNLKRAGINPSLIPSESKLQNIRELSSRATAHKLLPLLRSIDGTEGESYICKSLDEVEQLLSQYTNIVIKAPWSSSGRGLRFGLATLTDHQRGWVRNIIMRQGFSTVEPYYKKVKDFGMEFIADGNGNLGYCGLSLFSTHNGAYTGNIIATEPAKREILGRYAPLQLLDTICNNICQLLPTILGDYQGPVGVDMMILANGIVHPCVEINLRRTMGHVALAIQPPADDMVRTLRTEMINSEYKLKIRQL